MQSQPPISGVVFQDGGENDDCFNSLELRGDFLLEKILAMQATASSSSCAPQSSIPPQSRPFFPVKKGEVAADAIVPPPKSSSRVSTSPTSPTTSTRTLSSDDLPSYPQLQFPSQGQQLLSQQQQPPPQQHDHNRMPTMASNSSELEPLDFRQSNSFHSSSLLDLLLDGNGVVSRDENTDARTKKNDEFSSTRQDQTMLQDRLRQLGQSQMQQFLIQQLGQQPALILQQQQQRQRLPTDGIFSFKDLNTNSHHTSVQTTSSHQNLGNNSVNLPSEGKRSNIISHPNKSSTLNKKNSSKRSQTTSSSCLGKDSNQGSNSRARPASKKAAVSLRQVNSPPREPKATTKRNKKTNDSTFQYIKVVGGGMKRALDKPSIELAAPPKSKAKVELSSLHAYLDFILESRGYVTSKCSASELGYIKTPTPLQIASFATAVCSANKPGDAHRLKSILQCGLSANPMNKFGDSPFFIVCKRGVTELVQVFIDCGAEVRIADSFGRTPLHHVAWSNPPNFETAKIILTADPRLLYVMDKHGKTPLDFVAKGHSSDWIKFIDSMAGSLWPANAAKQCHPEPSKGAIPDPPNALSIKLAEDVASGRTKPEEVTKMLP